MEEARCAPVLTSLAEARQAVEGCCHNYTRPERFEAHLRNLAPRRAVEVRLDRGCVFQSVPVDFASP